MQAAAFDTLSLSKFLINSGGFDQRQAEALAEAIDRNSVYKEERKNLATKDDIKILGSQIRQLESRVDRLESRMDRIEERMERIEERIGRMEGQISQFSVELANTRASLIKWMVGLLIGFGALQVAALSALPFILEKIQHINP